MVGLKYILNPTIFRKYSTVIVAISVTAIGVFFLGTKQLISTNNLTKKTEEKIIPVQTLAKHWGWVYAVAITPDGKTLASSSYDGVIKIWNCTNGQLLRTINAHADAISSLAISADGKILASGSWDNRIKLWHLASGNLVGTLAGHNDDVKAIAMSGDGQTLVSGSYDGMVKVWNFPTTSVERTFQHSSAVTSLAVSSDGEILAVGGKNGQIKTWQLQTGKQLHSLAAHQNTIWAIAFSPNGKILATGGQDRKVKLWDVDTGQLQGILEGNSQAVLSVAFSPDSKFIANSGYNRDIQLWEVETQELLKAFTGHGKAVWSVKFNPDGETLASGSADGTIKIWSVSGWLPQENQTNSSGETEKEENRVVASEIRDTDKLEELKEKLYEQIDQSWRQTPSWSQDLIFRVRVNLDGVIFKLEPINQLANDYTKNTPLPKLLDSSHSGEMQKQPFAVFRVVMTPKGVLEISPWSGWF